MNIPFINSIKAKLTSSSKPDYGHAKYNAFDAFSSANDFTQRNYEDVIKSGVYAKLEPEQKIVMKALLQIIVNAIPTDVSRTYHIIENLEENLTKHFDAISNYLDAAETAMNEDRSEDAFKNAHIAKDISVPFCEMRAKVQSRISALSAKGKAAYFGEQLEDKETTIVDFSTRFQTAFTRAQGIMNQAKANLQAQNNSANATTVNAGNNTPNNTSGWKKITNKIGDSINNIFNSDEEPHYTAPILITNASLVPVPDKVQLTGDALRVGKALVGYDASGTLYDFEKQNLWIGKKRYHIIRRKGPPTLYALIDDKNNPKIQGHFLKYELIYSRDHSKVIGFKYMADSTTNIYKRARLS